MSFKNYLIESFTLNESADLVFQKVIDHVDDGHVDYSEDKIVFNIGKMIKDSRLSDLELVIRKGEESVKLGRKRDGETFAIVVNTNKKFPERMNIDDFLSTNKEVYNGFMREFKNYMKSHYNADKEVKPTSYEKRVSSNDRKSFEDNYSKLIQAIKGKLEEYERVKADLEQRVERSVNAGTKEAAKLAIERLKSEYVGKNFGAFKGIVGKLPEAEFIGLLNKDLSAKVWTRLEDYFEQTSS